jgi:hypothetical protein
MQDLAIFSPRLFERLNTPGGARRSPRGAGGKGGAAGAGGAPAGGARGGGKGGGKGVVNSTRGRIGGGGSSLPKARAAKERQRELREAKENAAKAGKGKNKYTINTAVEPPTPGGWIAMADWLTVLAVLAVLTVPNVPNVPNVLTVLTALTVLTVYMQALF